ncbi:MAG: putative dihydroorotase [Pirellulaceae bacterium]|nr:MAG: putative dihydroorotase [Pirellulaceae bacterium]GIW90764.1 MAG: putative dihydroorotase [Pirellulaceae bacterium]GIW94276.1 MAG: putative dihydroorotase [Pirellulaceae bacterium]
MARLWIRDGRVIDPASGEDRQTSLLIEDGRIAAWDVTSAEAEQVVDARGLIVAPGLIDLHCELREPGFEEDETIHTLTRAAQRGGFTSVVCIPETEPPVDTQAGVEFIRQKAGRAGHARVLVVACVSKNREGRELAEIGMLVEAGAVAFSDGSRAVQNSELLRRALEYCLMFDKPIFNHPEVAELSHRGIMHEGLVSLVLGLPGIPPEAEDVMTSRDLRLAESTGGRLHLLSISTAGSVDLVRRAKSRGVRVTADVSVAHLVFTDEKLRTFDSHFKLQPPLRSASDVEACLEGLKDGTIDAISSGHAPRAREKKMLELDVAPPGMIGLETTLSMVSTYLVRTGRLTWIEALEKLTIGPARVLGIPRGTLAVGSVADLVLIDPDYEWTVEPSRLVSSSANTPLLGSRLYGAARFVVLDGQLRPALAATNGS